MVDTTDLKSVDQLVVRVQVPLPPRIVQGTSYKNKALLLYDPEKFKDAVGETRTLMGIPART